MSLGLSNSNNAIQSQKATQSYHEILADRRADDDKITPSAAEMRKREIVDNRFKNLGVDVEREKERQGIKPYQALDISDELAKRIADAKECLKMIWKAQDAEQTPPKSVELWREKHLLTAFYVKDETEQQYYERQKTIKSLDAQIKIERSKEEEQVHQQKMQTDPDYKRTIEGLESSLTRINAARKTFQENVTQASSTTELVLPKVNTVWHEAREKALSQRDNQIRNLTEYNQASRIFTDQQLERAGYVEGVGIGTSKAKELNRSREFAITNSEMSSRWSSSSPLGQSAHRIEVGEANVAAGTHFKIDGGYGKEPVYLAKRSAQEIRELQDVKIAKTTELVERELARDPSGKSLLELRDKFSYRTDDGNFVIGSALTYFRAMSKDRPDNLDIRQITENLEVARSDYLHAADTKKKDTALEALGLNPDAMSIDEFKEFQRDFKLVNRSLSGKRLTSREKGRLQNICDKYGETFSAEGIVSVRDKINHRFVDQRRQPNEVA